MLHHADCGGELHKRTTSSTFYTCKACAERVYVGNANRPAGVNESNRQKGHAVGGTHTYYAKPPAQEEKERMSLHSSLIASGGKILVVGGNMNPNWARFAQHPQVVFWTGDKAEIQRHLKAEHNLPDNTKAVLISRFIGHSESAKVMAEARDRRALIIAPLNDGELTRKLEEIMTPNGDGIAKKVEVVKAETVVKTETPVKVGLRKPGRGDIQRLLTKHYDSSRPNVDEATRLLVVARLEGLLTTNESLQQGIYMFKKRAGITSPRAQGGPHGRIKVIPATVVTAPTVEPSKVKRVYARRTTKSVRDESVKGDELIKLLDDSIAGLELVRDQVVEFKGQRNEYLELKRKLAELLG